MKFSLTNRQPSQMLAKADEIRIAMRDYKALPDYVDDYPDKTLILEFSELPDDFSWDNIQSYSEALGGKFYCALHRMDLADECRKRNLKFYYKYPINSVLELNAITEYNVSYIIVGCSLMSSLNIVSTCRIPLRCYPNLAFEPYLSRKEGVIGGWVRPEDTKAYEKYFSVFDFYAPNGLKQEAALFKVYAEQGQWDGNLRYLITGLNVDADNRLFYRPDEWAERRMNCGYKCLTGHHCHICETRLKESEKLIIKYKEYKDEQCGVEDV